MNYEIPEVAEFTEEIERLETSTPGHAKFFNAIYEKIFHNTLFLRAKTAILESEIAKSIAIALGRNQALVFNTYDDMAAWFSDAANAENVAGLANGTNLYIIAKDVPDYWWSSVHQKYYELETQKVDLTKYDNIIGDTDISDIGDGTLTSGVKALNNNLGEINSNISGIRTYVGADGKLHFTDAGGADTALPFNNAVKIINLGTGTSFNVSSQKGYQKFTKDNFFVIPESFGNFSIADTQMGGGSANTTGISLPINKSYNAQTGQFTCSAQLNLSFYVRYSNGSGGSFGKNASVTCRVYLAY